MRTELAIFDLDGTLVDSAPDIHRSINEMLADYERPLLTFAETRPLIGDGARILVERVLDARPDGGRPVTVDAAVESYLAHYHAVPVGLTTLYPGVEAALGSLRSAGIGLALCTNKPERLAREVLAVFGLTHWFAEILGGDSLPTRKPDPDGLLTIARRHDVAPEEAVMIGDSEVDAGAAAAARMKFVLMTHGYHRGAPAEIQAVARLAHFAELPAALGARS